MAQIVNTPSAGGLVGSAFGQGVSTGIQQLLNYKMQEMQRQNDRNRVSSFLEQQLGLNPQQAQALSNAPESYLNQFLGQQLQQQQAQNFLSRLQESGGQLTPELEAEAAKYGTAGLGIAKNLRQRELQEREFGLKKEQFEESKRARSTQEARASNADFNKAINQGQQLYEKTSPYLDQLDKLVTSGSLSLLPGRGLLPSKLQSAKQQEYQSLVDTLASLGVKGAPPVNASPQTIKSWINAARQQVELPNIYARIRDDIVEKNNGVEPPNIRGLIQQRLGQQQEQEAYDQSLPGQTQKIGTALQSAANQEPGNESILDTLQRNLGSVLVSAATGISSAPASLASLALGGLNKASGGYIPTLEQAKENNPLLSLYLPSAQERRQMTNELFGEVTGKKDYFEPKSELARYINAGIEDLSSAAFFGPVTKAIAKTVAASNAAGYGLSLAGFSPESQAIGKIAVSLLPGISNLAKIGSMGRKNIEKAKDIGKGISVPNSGTLEPSVGNLYAILERAPESAQRNSLLDRVRDTYSKLRNNNLKANDLIELTDDVRQFTKKSGISSSEQSYVNQINNAFKEKLSSLPEKGFAEAYQKGTAIIEGLEQNSAIHNFIAETLPKKISSHLNPVTAYILGVPAAKITAGAGAIGAAAGYAEKVAKILQVPEIQEQVTKILQAAAQRRGPVVLNQVMALNDLINKGEK